MKPSFLFAALAFASVVALNAAGADEPLAHFRPGQIWNDASGKPINVHGGGELGSGGGTAKSCGLIFSPACFFKALEKLKSTARRYS